MIAISEDDDTVVLSKCGNIPVQVAAIRLKPPHPSKPKRILIFGRNRNFPAIINELDMYIAPGSAVSVVVDFPGVSDAGNAFAVIINPEKSRKLLFPKPIELLS